MILINGEEKAAIEVGDRGFQYGDGLFETVEIDQGVPIFLDAHLRRLQTDCARLSIPNVDFALVAEEARRLSKGRQQGILKIIITRGRGERGYRPPPSPRPTRVLAVYPPTDRPGDLGRNGVTVRICRTRLGSNPRLAGIKHLNRLEQILARGEWEDSGIHEGLMLDTDDNVIEGTMSNLFLVFDGVLHTPSLERCGVAGIIRALVMEQAERAGREVRVGIIDKSRLTMADELFLTNSVIGVWPITLLEGRSYPVGPLATQAMAWIEACKRQEAGFR